MSEIEQLTNKLLEFRRERDWEKFHNQKDMALSLCLEASEVLEHFQWKNGVELDKYVTGHKEEIGEELADVFNWILLMSHDLGINICDALNEKIEKNALKYPVAKVKGRADKYTTY